jgi:hypothetical protein
MTVNADNFKPIDKFDNTAELKMYKLNWWINNLKLSFTVIMFAYIYHTSK